MPSPPSEEERNPSEEEEEDDEEELNPCNKNGEISSPSSSSSSSSSDSHFEKPAAAIPPKNGSGKRPADELSPEYKRPMKNEVHTSVNLPEHNSEPEKKVFADSGKLFQRLWTDEDEIGPEKKVFDDSRKLFQRLWTDEDEIGLLKGFLEYSRKGSPNFHDMAPFYDQIKTSLQLDFNKNQLVEKLRRLKKKYRNVVSKIGSGKEFSFKSAHDQATFEISRKIWSGGIEEGGEEEEEGNNQEKKAPKNVKRPRKVCNEDNSPNNQNSITNVVEESVRNCLSPLFKEFLYCAINGPCNSGYGVALNALPLSFGSSNALSFAKPGPADEKWRKQQILELEVYSKRIELVQEQIKSTLEELKSMGT